MTDYLNHILTPDKIKLNEPMKNHTTFRTGGPADYFVTPSAVSELVAVSEFCRERGITSFILGNGSNVLFSDGGYRGVVISMKGFSSLQVNGDIITAGAGVMLKDLSDFAMRSSLSGLEFSCGIPGTAGGAVCMNAGAYDSSVSAVFHEGEFIDGRGEQITLPSSEMRFGYRTSLVQPGKLIAISASFKLFGADESVIAEKIRDLTLKRESKQPLADPSAGSTFKRPQSGASEQLYAGKLIEDSGLRGFSVGGAAVSQKHCGFVVNLGHASSADILAVIQHVQDTVYRKFNVMLETEVKIIE
jgi:UDP-N-acetylmuramate dehydrogenase